MAKVGVTTEGARAARLHTGSDTGDDPWYARLFEQYGIQRAGTIGELFRLGYTLARGRPPRRSAETGGAGADAPLSLAIVSISGGVGIMVADRVVQWGMALPPLPEEPARRLRAAVPFASTVNPIDVTGQVFSQPQVFVDAMQGAATCGEYGYVAVFLAGTANAPGVWPVLQQSIAAIQSDPDAAPLVFCGIVGAEQKAWLESQGCLIFREPADAVDAVAALARQAGSAPAPTLSC